MSECLCNLYIFKFSSRRISNDMESSYPCKKHAKYDENPTIGGDENLTIGRRKSDDVA